MSQPLIGITTSRAVNPGEYPSAVLSEKYIEAILLAGGVPVLIPNLLPAAELETLRTRLDGILLTGGSDVDPARFNGAPHPEVYGIYPERDASEITLVQRAVESGQPFMGICRGVQVTNVALGGTLYTHIADQLKGAIHHTWYPNIDRSYLAHTVSIQPGSLLARILGSTEAQVNSLHHQGLQQVAPGLRPIAWSPDGLVEAVEVPGHPFALGVQWHPEWLVQYPPMLALFKALVKAAQ